MKMKMIYEARTGSPFKKEEAQDIGELISGIKEKSTENILTEIKNHPTHCIYKYIEWDDRKAGQKYRLSQVRNIVNHIEVKVISIGNPVPIRAFFSVKESESTEPIYVDVETTFNDSYTRQQIVSRAKNELQNWKERYYIYTELEPIVKVITSFLEEKPKGKRKKATKKAFIVNSKDLMDKKKNPNLSFSPRDIEKNKKIPKKYLE